MSDLGGAGQMAKTAGSSLQPSCEPEGTKEITLKALSLVQLDWQSEIQVPQNDKRFTDLYMVSKELAQGGEAIVYEVTRRSDGNRFAASHWVDGVSSQYNEHGIVKHGGNTGRTAADITQEVYQMVAVQCQYVIQIVDFFQDELESTVVMELCSADLQQSYSILGGVGGPSIGAVRQCTANVLLGLLHIHSLGYVHNDVKLENILVQDPESLDGVRICDFGIAKKQGEVAPIQSSWWNMCPETVAAIRRKQKNIVYCEKLDIWALGVIVFGLVTGYPAFYSAQPQQMLDNIANARWMKHFIKPQYKSPELLDFLRTVFNTNPDERPGAADLLRHEWLAGTVQDPPVAHTQTSASLTCLTTVDILHLSRSHSADGSPRTPDGLPLAASSQLGVLRQHATSDSDLVAPSTQSLQSSDLRVSQTGASVVGEPDLEAPESPMQLSMQECNTDRSICSAQGEPPLAQGPQVELADVVA